MNQTDSNIDSLLEEIERQEKHQRRGFKIWAILLAVFVALIIGGAVWLNTQANEEKAKSLALAVEAEDLRTNLKVEQKKLEEEKRYSESVKLERRGVELAMQGNLSEAIEYYSMAIEKSPKNAGAHQFRGYALLRKGDIDRAIADLQRSVEIDPEYIWAHYNLALAYWQAGDQTKSLSSLARVLEIEPSFRETIARDVQFRKFRSSNEFKSLLSTGS